MWILDKVLTIICRVIDWVGSIFNISTVAVNDWCSNLLYTLEGSLALRLGLCFFIIAFITIIWACLVTASESDRQLEQQWKEMSKNENSNK